LPNPNYTTLAGDGPIGRLLHGGGGIGGGLATPGLGAPGIGTPGFGSGGFSGGGLGAGLRQHHGQLARLFGGGCLLNGLHSGGAGVGGCLNGGCQLMRGLGNGIHGLGRGCLGLGCGAMRGIGNCGLASCALCSRGAGNCGAGDCGAGNYGAGAFSTPPMPPLCGADGRAPSGSPCYPVGSPSASSLEATLPGSQVGSGLSRGLRSPNATCGCDAYNGPIGSQMSSPLSNRLSSQQRALGNQQQFGPGVVISQPRLRAYVGQEVVLLGGIQTGTGIARPNELVQWSLANNSVGTFVDAAKPATRGILLRIFRKGPSSCSTGTCGNCVPSITARQCEHLVRSPNDPSDDIYLSRGQSWVSLTSASPGMSYVTLSAPQACGRKFANAIVEWVAPDDAYLEPVNPSTNPQGQISPPDGFEEPVTSPSDSFPPREMDSSFDPGGAGDLPSSGATPPVPLDRDRAVLGIKADGPPAGEVGGPLDYVIQVTNNSEIEAQTVVVSMDNLPAGVQVIQSDMRPQSERPPAWVFERLAPGESRTINVRLASDRPVRLGNRFYAVARNAPEVMKGVNTNVNPPSLLMELMRNEPFTPRPGSTFQQPIQIVNQLPRPQDIKLQIIDWDRGIEPIGSNPERQPNPALGVDQVFRVGGNGRKVAEIQFKSLEPGTHGFRVVATSEDGKQVTREGRVQVLATERPHMQVRVNGREALAAGESDGMEITVVNDGQVPITNGQLIVQTEGDIQITGWRRQPRRLGDRTLVWDIETLAPGYRSAAVIQVTADRNPATGSGSLQAEAKSDQGRAESEKFPVRIRELRNRQRVNRTDIDRTESRFSRTNLRSVSHFARDEKESLSMDITAREAVRINEPIEYELIVENNNPRSFRNVQVSVSVSSGMEMLNLGSPTGSHHKVSSDRRMVDFETIKEVLPRERLLFKVRAVQTERGSRAKLLGQLYATGLSSPLTVVKETNHQLGRFH